MKKFLFLTLITLLAVACKPDEPKAPFKLNPDATILLKPDKSGWTKSAMPMQRAIISGLTGDEIVEQALNIKWQGNWAGNRYRDEPYFMARGFAEAQRDLSIPALKMWGTDILWQEHPDSIIALQKDFLYGFEVYLTDGQNDTIGYIPESVLENARILIEAAYSEQDYEEIYRIFNDAYTFLPF